MTDAMARRTFAMRSAALMKTAWPRAACARVMTNALESPMCVSLVVALIQTAPIPAACAPVTTSAMARTTSAVQNVALMPTAAGRARHAVATTSAIKVCIGIMRTLRCCDSADFRWRVQRLCEVHCCNVLNH